VIEPSGAAALAPLMRADRATLERLQRTIPDVVDRVRFVPPQTNEDYLALTAIGDAVLDPPVFGGGHTTLEALAAGRPVITLPGRFLRGRLTQAFLRHCGQEGRIAGDISEYVELALAAGRAGGVPPDPADNGPLFDDKSTLREHEEFFIAAREAARRDQRLAAWPA